MNLRFFLIMGLALISYAAIAQPVSDGVGIGTLTPDASAILHIQPPSNNKGLLIPRITSTTNIASPAEGLLVYDEVLNRFCFYDGSSWLTLNEMVRGVGSTTVTHSGNVSVTGTITATDYGLNATGNGPVPRGGIIMWSGSTVPTGWALCNGTSGTPDLRGRFIVGSGQNQTPVSGDLNPVYVIGQTAGQNHVTLGTAQIPAHSHTMQSAGDHNHYVKEVARGDEGSSGTDQSVGSHDEGGTQKFTDTTGSHVHSIDISGGGNGAHENRPPYYVLAFIHEIMIIVSKT